ncbi:MAG: hypothetical protein V1694_00695 [Candidatus Eisenbacteria bacterium]
MFCPKCGAEYLPGITECADCSVPLVPQPVESKPPRDVSDLPLVTVFESGNPALIALASSVLESARIEFATKGEALQDLLGWGRFPCGANLAMGPVLFQVRPEDVEEARSLLCDLEEGEEDSAESAEKDDTVG